MPKSRLAAYFATLALAGCDAAAGQDYACVDGPTAPELLSPADRAAWDTLHERRRECEFKKDDHTSVTLGAPPLPAAVEHVIVLMRENRSFDHFLGEYEPADGPPVDAWNPDPAMPGLQVTRRHETAYCTPSFNHHWGGTHLQYNNGRMNGFVASNHFSTPGASHGAMNFYNREDLPLYYWLAENFAISDRYFSSILGPTMPNLMHYYRATSCGYFDNSDPLLYLECGSRNPAIFSLLEDADVSYGVYSDARPPQGSAAIVLGALDLTHGVGSIQDLIDDIDANTLPSVVFIEPNYGHSGFGTQNDDHAPVNIQISQQFVHGIVSAVMSKPEVWRSSIMFITWDEHGGYYDHVPPPKACLPEDATEYDFKANRYGIRVPFFAISPFAKEGYVSHYVGDHTSILRFIEHWKDLPAMTNRDANAWPLLDMFDFDRAPRDVAAPSDELAPLSTDPEHVGSCDAWARVAS